MRTIGVTVLGLFSGALLGIALTDLVARLSVPDGGTSMPSASVYTAGFAPPLLAVLGAVVGVAIDWHLRNKDKE